MGQVAVGTVVLINFPYADLKLFKKRPAVVVAKASLNTVILCQITSHQLPDVPSVVVTKEDFKSGNLPITSYVCPDKLFTVDASIAEQNRLGVLADHSLNEIKKTVRSLFA